MLQKVAHSTPSCVVFFFFLLTQNYISSNDNNSLSFKNQFSVVFYFFKFMELWGKIPEVETYIISFSQELRCCRPPQASNPRCFHPVLTGVANTPSIPSSTEPSAHQVVSHVLRHTHSWTFPCYLMHFST